MPAKDKNAGTRAPPVAAEITELRARLALAESQRDAWRAAGRMEDYLAACSTVDSLALRLGRLEETARFAAARRVAIIPSTEPPAASSDRRARELVQLCITFNGRKYGYRGYRYDRFADAVSYARLDRLRAFADPGADDAAPLERAPAPSEREHELMRTLGITFADGVFHWRQYCYDRLADAVAYARRENVS